jgi:hypothetical protein
MSDSFGGRYLTGGDDKSTNDTMIYVAVGLVVVVVLLYLYMKNKDAAPVAPAVAKEGWYPTAIAGDMIEADSWGITSEMPYDQYEYATHKQSRFAPRLSNGRRIRRHKRWDGLDCSKVPENVVLSE